MIKLCVLPTSIHFGVGSDENYWVGSVGAFLSPISVSIVFFFFESPLPCTTLFTEGITCLISIADADLIDYFNQLNNAKIHQV